MYIPFREYHLMQFFAAFEQGPYPLDYSLTRYFRRHKALGSKDRAFIADAVYGMVRWKGLLDALSSRPSSWEERWIQYRDFDPTKYLEDASLAPNVRCGFPNELYERIVDNYGIEKGTTICLACNTPAPLYVRVNLLKTTRQDLFDRWNKQFKVSLCKESATGIRFHQKINFSTLPEFVEGLFEVQDEGSQLLANLVDAKPGQLVLDYCAGSGGKSLAIAPKMEEKGQIFLHDIRPQILINARKRLNRAGIQNTQFLNPGSPQLKKLKKKMDWVLVDAPCSGTGSLRRNPDMKWKYSDKGLFQLVGEQRHIFEKALSFVKPGGHIVYATCSILKVENQQQVEHFLSTYPMTQVSSEFQSIPEERQMDGFFGAVFRLND